MEELPLSEQIDNVMPFIQGLYNQFKTIGITITADDAPMIYQSCHGGSHEVFSKFCEDKLLGLAEYANVVGLGLSRNKTLALVKLPDYEFIRHWILNDPAAQFRGNSRWGITQDQADSLTIINDVVRYK